MPPRRPCRPAAHSRAAELGGGVAEDDDAPARSERRRRGPVIETVDQPDDTDHRGRVDVGAIRLVVEAHVAADDGQLERPAGLGHPVHDLGELPHHLGVLGVAEVEAVHQRQVTGPGAGDVADGLEHGERPAGPGVEEAEPGLPVGGQRQGLAGLPQPQDGGVATRAVDGVEEQLVVVLAPDPRRVGDVGQRQHPEQLGTEVGAGREPLLQGRTGVGGDERVLVCRPGHGPVVDRAVAEALGRHVGQQLVTAAVEQAVVDPEPASRGHPADHRRPDLPPPAQGQNLVEVRGGDDGQHPLLALGDHHLHRVHPRFPAGDPGDVDVHPHAALGGRLGGGAGDTAGAEVLHTDRQPGVEQRQAGLDQLLLFERISDLDGGAFVGRRFIESGRRQDAGTADPVTPG